MDWAKFIADKAKTNAIINSQAIATELDLPINLVRRALRRQERRGLVEHVAPKLYINKLAAGFNSKELASKLWPDSYISLDSALHEWGISSQAPVALTCVATKQIPDVKTSSVRIVFRMIKRSLFWGFVEKNTRYGPYKIADREKTFLDWVYFRRKDGVPSDFYELNLRELSRSKLLEYSDKYPRALQQALYPILIQHQFAA
jgi:predicted transcriptional regulator of viral defense system